MKVNAARARITVVGLVCLAAIASAPLAVGGFGSLGSFGTQGIALPSLASAQQLMAMLDARSPGEREKGALTQTKVKQRLAFVPRERALGKTFPPKPSPMEQLVKVVVPAPPPVQIVPPIAPLVPPTTADIINPATLVASLPPVGGGTPIIGGGGGLLPPPPPTGTVPPTGEVPPGTPVSAVPEPGTWLTMLLGFGMIGTAMNRRRRQSRLATA
nr:PEPxxWA-CTERM sorting domain-containing protein [Sphingomonas kaistensis]